VIASCIVSRDTPKSAAASDKYRHQDVHRQDARRGDCRQDPERRPPAARSTTWARAVPKIRSFRFTPPHRLAHSIRLRSCLLAGDAAEDGGRMPDYLLTYFRFEL
jgi:hypothetical protein